MELTEINRTAQEHSPAPQEGTPGKSRFLALSRITRLADELGVGCAAGGHLRGHAP